MTDDIKSLMDTAAQAQARIATETQAFQEACEKLVKFHAPYRLGEVVTSNTYKVHQTEHDDMSITSIDVVWRRDLDTGQYKLFWLFRGLRIKVNGEVGRLAEALVFPVGEVSPNERV